MTDKTKRTEEFRFDGEQIWMKIKAFAKAGNIRRVVFRNKKNESIFSLTVTIAVILTIIAPQIVIIVTLVALLIHCSVVIEKESEEVVEEKVNEVV